MPRAEAPGAARLRTLASQARVKAQPVQDILATDGSMTEAELEAAESVIRAGRDAFIAVGQALAAIRDGKGYRHRGYGTFENYVREVWGWGRRHGYNLIAAAEVAENVQAIAQPNLTQAIDLATLPAEDQRAVATEVDLATTSARELRTIVRDRRGKPPPVRTWAAPVPRPTSVFDSDQQALASLLPIMVPWPGRIVDVTHAEGVMWRGLDYHPYRTDIDPWLLRAGAIDEVCNFTSLPFEDGSYECIVFDPPYLTDSSDGAMGSDQARNGATTWADRYGLGSAGPKGDNISPLFTPFLIGALRVLTPGGIVLAKLSNMVHSQRYQDQARMFKNAAEQVGFTHCFEGIVVNDNRGQLLDPKWQAVHHPRTIHTYWIVLRKGPRCQR
jgi:hypothetical protein